jgi:hypothetical protein
MKSLSIFALLVLVAACNVDKKSVKKECTINGVKRDFSECEKTQNPQTAAETVKVSINFSIDLQSEMNQLDILGNYYDSDYGRRGQECKAEVFSGTRLELRRSGDTLVIRDGGKSTRFTRYGSEKAEFLGGWYMKKDTSYGSREEFLTLHNSRMATLSVYCNFQ